MTPASPKTYVVEKNGTASEGFTREPVIGFIPAGKDGTEPPKIITLAGHRRILDDDNAILFPCGMVVAPNGGFSFEDTDEWLAFKGGTKPRAEREGKATERANKSAETGSSGGDFTYQIEWTHDTLKQQSFWSYEDDKTAFVFAVPGGDPLPKRTDIVQKVKRTDYDNLRKSVDALDLADVKSPKAAPLDDGDDGGEEDEDDDGADLI